MSLSLLKNRLLDLNLAGTKFVSIFKLGREAFSLFEEFDLFTFYFSSSSSVISYCSASTITLMSFPMNFDEALFCL